MQYGKLIRVSGEAIEATREEVRPGKIEICDVVGYSIPPQNGDRFVVEVVLPDDEDEDTVEQARERGKREAWGDSGYTYDCDGLGDEDPRSIAYEEGRSEVREVEGLDDE